MVLVIKKIIQKFLSLITSLYYSFKLKTFKCSNALLFLVRLTGIKNNIFKFDNVVLKDCRFDVKGQQNKFNINGCHWQLEVNVCGDNNTLILESASSLNRTKIIIRGNNCVVKIGKNTTVGSAYIVCMGQTNSVEIGYECMLAENIEIWNTDSHPIYNKEGVLINSSKPIYIGNHVWCGKGVKILKGVTIGDNSVIGMGSLVTSNITHNTLNVGIPSKEIKKEINWNRAFITE